MVYRERGQREAAGASKTRWNKPGRNYNARRSDSEMTTLTVYVLNQSHRGRFVTLKDSNQLHDRYEDANTRPFYGEAMKPYWTPLELVDGEESMEIDGSVFYSFQSFMVFDQKSHRSYKSLFEPFGEFLPAIYRSEEVQLFHCTNILDGAIDKENTVYEPGHICGPLIDFRRVCFDQSVVNRPMFFRSNYVIYSQLWFSTIGDETELLQFFLNHQTGFRPEPVYVSKLKP